MFLPRKEKEKIFGLAYSAFIYTYFVNDPLRLFSVW